MRVTYKQAVSFLIAGAFCFQLLALNVLTKKLWLFTVAWCVGLFLLAKHDYRYWLASVRPSSSGTSRIPQNACIALLLYLVSMIAWQFLQNCSPNPYEYSRADSLDVLLDTFALLFICCLFGLLFPSLSVADKLCCLTLGIAAFGAVNMLASALGVSATSEFGTSRLDPNEARQRWVPPLAMSSGVFAMTQAAAACYLAFYTFGRGPNSRAGLSPLRKILVLAGLGSSLWAVYLCEQRAQLVVIAVTLVAVFFSFWQRFWWQTGLALIFAVPALEVMEPGTVTDRAAKVLFAIAPASVAQSFTTTTSLENRAQLWAYGAELLARPDVFLFGEGPVLRDSNPALAEAYSQARVGATTSFHGGAVDLLVANGVIVGMAVAACLFLVSFGLSRPPNSESKTLLAAYGAIWTWLSIIDGGMFARTDLMVLAIAPVASIAASMTGIGGKE